MNARELILAGALVVLTVLVGRWHKETAAGWEARANAVEGFAAAQTERVHTLTERATTAETAADSLLGELHGRDQALRERADVVMGEAVPDTCVSFVEPREEIIREYQGLSLEWAAAMSVARSTAHFWRQAYTVQTEVSDSLLAVLEDRSNADPWWLPTLGVGTFLGVDFAGRPTAGVGFTLSWRM